MSKRQERWRGLSHQWGQGFCQSSHKGQKACCSPALFASLPPHLSLFISFISGHFFLFFSPTPFTRPTSGHQPPTSSPSVPGPKNPPPCRPPPNRWAVPHGQSSTTLHHQQGQQQGPTTTSICRPFPAGSQRQHSNPSRAGLTPPAFTIFAIFLHHRPTGAPPRTHSACARAFPSDFLLLL